METKNDKKQEIKDFKKLKKNDLVEIIYQLESMNLALKSKIVELERIIEERGNLINVLNDTVKNDQFIFQNYKCIIDTMKNGSYTNIDFNSKTETEIDNNEKRKMIERIIQF